MKIFLGGQEGGRKLQAPTSNIQKNINNQASNQRSRGGAEGRAGGLVRVSGSSGHERRRPWPHRCRRRGRDLRPGCALPRPARFPCRRRCLNQFRWPARGSVGGIWGWVVLVPWFGVGWRVRQPLRLFAGHKFGKGHSVTEAKRATQMLDGAMPAEHPQRPNWEATNGSSQPQ